MASAAAPPQPATPAPRPPRQRLNKLERTQLRRDLAHHDKHSDGPAQDHHQGHAALDWLPLADTRTHQCPLVFTPDGSYAFIASGAAVKVYSVASTQLMSTLSIRPYSPSSASTTTTTDEPAALRRATVSAVLLSPSNPRQLVVAATDGKVRLWDYLDGALLRTLDLGAPILHATANPNLADHLFVALGTNSTLDAEASVYLVSLRAAKHLVDGLVSAADPTTPVQPARRVRLATPRVVRTLALSPDGAVLASVTPDAVHLARTADIQRGFTQSVPAADDERLTAVAFHPTDTYFATGNERGQIRLWYNVLAAAAGDEPAPAPTTSVLHWHAHAVSALAFTPNGAYLLSGGQEAVLVLWQLHTGHQEYVPRLGAPISSLTVLDGTRENPEQQVAARLSDGSVAFVGSQRLRVGKVISGLKADASSRPTFAPAPSSLPTPLALDPSTSALVLPAAHPSSLQFYSPLDDASVLELEVAPSNRVTSAQRDRPLEPTRVERVAFSTPEPKHGGAYWMATVDSWAKDGFTPVRQLKLWRKQLGAAADAQQQSFVLSTRIDRPHDGPITSLAFSPSTASPLLLTTSTDGSIKVWAPTSSSSASSSSSSAAAGGSWACRAALSHRASAPVAGAWSADGSMFAVAHVRGSVTLWSLAQGGVLMHSFAAPSVGRPRHVAFVEGEGDAATALVVAGSRGSIAWDLLTLDEVHTTSIDFATLAVERESGRLLGTEDAAPAASSSSTSTSAKTTKATKASKAAPSPTSTDAPAPALLYSLPVASTSREAALAHLDARPLPFAPRQLLPLPSSASISTSSSSSAGTSSRRTGAHAVSLAAVDTVGAVSLLGAVAALGGTVAPSALPQAAGTGAKEGLFDEIFGSASSAATASSSRGKGKGRAAASGGADEHERLDKGALGKGAAVLLETPAHVLPPVRMLWRELLRVEQRPAVALELESGEGGSSAAAAAMAATSSSAPAQQREVASATAAPVFSSLGQETMRGIFSRRLAGGAAGSA